MTWPVHPRWCCVHVAAVASHVGFLQNTDLGVSVLPADPQYLVVFWKESIGGVVAGFCRYLP